jgi:hypothetical protein
MYRTLKERGLGKNLTTLLNQMIDTNKLTRWEMQDFGRYCYYLQSTPIHDDQGTFMIMKSLLPTPIQ